MRYSLRLIVLGGIISLALTQKQREMTDLVLLKSDAPMQAMPDNTIVRLNTIDDNFDIRYGKPSSQRPAGAVHTAAKKPAWKAIRSVFAA